MSDTLVDFDVTEPLRIANTMSGEDLTKAAQDILSTGSIETPAIPWAKLSVPAETKEASSATEEKTASAEPLSELGILEKLASIPEGKKLLSEVDAYSRLTSQVKLAERHGDPEMFQAAEYDLASYIEAIDSGR